MSDYNEKFQTRRFEQLANTIFGVAMTLLAYDFPKERLGDATPEWGHILHAYVPHLIALLLSFVVAGLFWFSHQRRLAYAPEVGRGSVLVELLFLLSIILLPASTGLIGAYPDARDVATLYGLHLFVISLLNLALWWMAVAPHRDWHLLVGGALTALIFLLAAVVAFLAPGDAKFVWSLAFVSPLAASLAERRARGKTVA